MNKPKKVVQKLQDGEALVVAPAADLLHLAVLFEALAAMTESYTAEESEGWIATANHFRSWVAETANYGTQDDESEW